jgi:hypothetical protein
MKLIQINWKKAVARLMSMTILSTSVLMYSCADKRDGQERFEDPRGDQLVGSDGTKEKDSFGTDRFVQGNPGNGPYQYGAGSNDREEGGDSTFSGTGLMGSGTHGETRSGGTNSRNEDGPTTRKYNTSTTSDREADTLTRPDKSQKKD